MSAIVKEPAYMDRTERWMLGRWTREDFRPAASRVFGIEPQPRNPFAGVCVGASVVVLSLRGRESGWQVWCHGQTDGWWWLANGREFTYAHEGDLEVIGQAGEDVSLFAS